MRNQNFGLALRLSFKKMKIQPKNISIFLLGAYLGLFSFSIFQPNFGLYRKLKTLEGEMQNKLKIVKARKRQNLALSCDLN